MPDTTPLAPMTPHPATSAFNYLRAVQADNLAQVNYGKLSRSSHETRGTAA